MLERNGVRMDYIIEKRRDRTVDLAKGQNSSACVTVVTLTTTFCTCLGWKYCVSFVGAFESEFTGKHCACAGARARTSPFQPSFLAHSLIYGPLLPNLLITHRVKCDRQNKLKFLGNVVFLSEIWISIATVSCSVSGKYSYTRWKVVDVLNACNFVKKKIAQHILRNGCKGPWWI